MLKSKPIKAPKEPSDGVRISVMSRHTLADGVTPDPEIKPDSYDEWWPELAPAGGLIGAYYKRGLSWEQFQESYVDGLQDLPKVQELIQLALGTTVTVLCVEETPYQCHRRLLVEECQRRCDELETAVH